MMRKKKTVSFLAVAYSVVDTQVPISYNWLVDSLILDFLTK